MAKRKAAAKKPTGKRSKASTSRAKRKPARGASATKASRKPAQPKSGRSKATKSARRKVAKRTPPTAPAALAERKGRYATAESMARAQRSISVSEFFAKNRHLLGFDNPRKALLTAVKEAVDNALDACEEAGILPRIEIRIQQLGETHFKTIVQDNGPGIVKKQIPSIFGQLLYGSKFHRLRMSRGQQGIGISAAGMYGLLTTGQPVRITSRTSPRAKAHYYELQIDTKTNRPDVIRDDQVEWDVPHGTQVEIELEAKYKRGRQSVDDYLQQTAIANPHVTFVYQAPDGTSRGRDDNGGAAGSVDIYEASVKKLPPTPKSIRPHPYGIELGVLIKMLQDTRAKSLRQFLIGEFSRVSPRVAAEIIERSAVRKNARTASLDGEDAKAIYAAIQETRILAPATDCVVPIGEEQLLAGLRAVVEARFYTAATRRPAVYRGNPFIIEAGLAYGRPERKEGEEDHEGTGERKAGKAAGRTKAPRASAKEEEKEEASLAKVIRFANRVPLQYQQGACAITKAVTGLKWRAYGLAQGRGALPSGDLTIVVHMASVWVPFTSESKEAIASYPEILKEIRLALQECGRKLATHIRKTVRIRQELRKRSYIEKYIPAIGEALRDILDLKPRQVDTVCARLKEVLERSRKF